MRKPTWLLLIAGLLACGLIAAGCGDDEGDSSSSTPTTSETAATDDTAASTEDTSTAETTSEDTTSSDSAGQVDTDAFVAECIKQADTGGPSAEDLAKQACEQLGAALEQCADSPDADVESCQEAADEATKQLEASGGA